MPGASTLTDSLATLTEFLCCPAAAMSAAYSIEKTHLLLSSLLLLLLVTLEDQLRLLIKEPSAKKL